jgi:alkylation response protein AidB-like acyl-CoA dehydrogenase
MHVKNSSLFESEVAPRPIPEDGLIEDLYRRARSFVPEIQNTARAMNEAGRLDNYLVDRLEGAGLFSLLVPKLWGGHGLGLREAHRVIEILAAGDCSTSWVASFFIVHSALLCRFPMEVQKEIYRDRTSVRAAAVWSPPGKAEKVDGGYRVTGKWAYASGVYHAHFVLVPALIEKELHWFLAPRENLTTIDDWDMTAMAATGSATAVAEQLFVRDGWHMEISKIVSATDHYGTAHDERIYRFPFTAFLMMTPSIAIGGLSRALELGRLKLTSSKPYGIARIERAAARIRWAEAYEKLRIIRVLRDAVENDMNHRDFSQPPSLELEGSVGLDSIAIVHGACKAARALIDGAGSSTYKGSDPLPRIVTDLSMIATHVLGYDYDVLMDRNARWLLGLGLSAEDSKIRL